MDSPAQPDTMPQPATEGEVILIPPSLAVERPTFKGRKWCFTINNYTDEDIKQVSNLTEQCDKYIYGFEGKDATPHVQGYIIFGNAKRFRTLRKALPRAHWEVAKGTPDQNYRYCAKEGNFLTNMEPPGTPDTGATGTTRQDLLELVRAQYENVEWKPWQEEVIDIADTCTSTRTIYWIYESTGNVGKSFVAKYLCLRPTTVICEGKKGDIFQQVNALIESNNQPKLIIVDCPRTCLDFVSYQAIECLKNGLLYSGKYEGGRCIFPSPTVICFANERPKISKMSLDRWKIFCIKDDELFAQQV